MAGILLVDKPGGITSHDVVSRARKALGTRKIGHAGTLDPMATGLLVLGVDSATRLLTYMVGLDKTYEATIRLGVATDSDDADGAVTATADAAAIAAVAPEAIARGIAELTGDISQVPSRVSAIKVNGKRAYDLVRAGEDVQLASRAVTVSRFDVVTTRRSETAIDLDVVVDCTSGTYIRALARDLGGALGVGGHLTALRRTRIGPFSVTDAVAIDDIDASRLVPQAQAAAGVLGTFPVTADEARDLRQGKRLTGAAERLHGPHMAAIDPDGRLVGVVERRGADVKSAMNIPEDAA
ncbi:MULTISPECIES: tRNA pseudouridine(55) synthase TruB [unclassified Microbacterium]|uniref:tRNA pseudouridine(55) synthase TruB n=1 Tax=unclassified Microbacterium TaxID=2609290 RepID=UPI00214C42E7|nr:MULTISPECIES: tRNA pseudouridine(55) synthase TruB [unclassified Microbacterium]MCR2786056.1 tRNA pseudouridine(55) synthase TruB [Microbacterium sp. zg.B96]MDL5352979.1 tRNA pseudouridine(55) synthase TruB [Microbacterium sp. zg-YB36]WIM16913.1 tRNA pseudouridine(55) synthase TruB [Microbacterium sp. zg-B96]